MAARVPQVPSWAWWLAGGVGVAAAGFAWYFWNGAPAEAGPRRTEATPSCVDEAPDALTQQLFDHAVKHIASADFDASRQKVSTAPCSTRRAGQVQDLRLVGHPFAETQAVCSLQASPVWHVHCAAAWSAGAGLHKARQVVSAPPFPGSCSVRSPARSIPLPHLVATGKLGAVLAACLGGKPCKATWPL